MEPQLTIKIPESSREPAPNLNAMLQTHLMGNFPFPVFCYKFLLFFLHVQREGVTLSLQCSDYNAEYPGLSCVQISNSLRTFLLCLSTKWNLLLDARKLSRLLRV